LKRGRRPNQPNPHAERARLLRRAQDCFTRGAACLLDAHDRDQVAAALIWAGLAALRIAQSDASFDVRERAQEFLAEMKKHARSPEPSFAGDNPGVGL
jgi:hypothetical protein